MNQSPQIPSPQAQPEVRSSLRGTLVAVMQSAGIFACVLVAVIALAIGGGYAAGTKDKQAQATATTSAEMQRQFALSQQDMQKGNYIIAVQRLRWILGRDNGYPGAAQALQQAESQLNITATVAPTLAPLSGSSPDTLFAQGQDYFNKQDWANSIRQLQALQAVAPDYRSEEVQAMLYQALVTLGLQDVRGDRLDEGVFFLQQAARLKPLDDKAAGELNMAGLYIAGRTYSGLNWPIAIKNFEALYAFAPNYRDLKDRLVAAYVAYADQLTAAGGYCDAAGLYQKAQDITPKDEVKAKLDVATEQCAHPTPGGPPTTGTPGTPGLFGTPTPGETPTPKAP